MAILPSLSLKHPRITIPLSEHVGDMVSFAADPGGNVPVPLARPSGDNLCRGDSDVALQMTNLSYGFDTAAIGHQITVTFQSLVAGFAELAAYYSSIDSAALPSTLGFGRYTGASIYSNSGYPQFVGAALNYDASNPAGWTGSTFGGSLVDFLSGYDLFRGNNQYGRFRWGWFTPGSGGQPGRFPVVVGTNTIIIFPGSDSGSLGAGCILDAIHIRLLRDKSQSEPRGFFPDLSFGINLGSVQAKLGAAGGCRAVYMGDSFAVGGCMAPLRDEINTVYPLSGLAYSLNSGAADAAAGGSTWASTNATAAIGTVSYTASGGANVGGQLLGTNDYQWSQGQTGNIAITLPAGTAYWQVIFGRSAASAPFTWKIDSGSTTSVTTASSTAKYGQVSGTLTPDGSSHTLTLAKADTTAADGLRLSYVIVAKNTTGHIALRICASGQAPNDFFPGTNNATWASFAAAFAPNLWLFENQNWQSGHDSAGGYDYIDYALALEAILPTLTDTSGALFALTTWWNFNSGTFTWSGNIIPPNMASARELERQMIDRALYGRLPRPVAVLDFGQWCGWRDIEAMLYNAGGYVTQTTAGSASGTITSFHGSTVGYAMAGSINGKIATGEILASSPVRRLAVGDDLSMEAE